MIKLLCQSALTNIWNSLFVKAFLLKIAKNVPIKSTIRKIGELNQYSEGEIWRNLGNLEAFGIW